jgi:hypothetical protein
MDISPAGWLLDMLSDQWILFGVAKGKILSNGSIHLYGEWAMRSISILYKLLCILS